MSKTNMSTIFTGIFLRFSYCLFRWHSKKLLQKSKNASNKTPIRYNLLLESNACRHHLRRIHSTKTHKHTHQCKINTIFASLRIKTMLFKKENSVFEWVKFNVYLYSIWSSGRGIISRAKQLLYIPTNIVYTRTINSTERFLVCE